MTTPTLPPCPFCGNPVKVVPFQGNYTRPEEYCVWCTDCDISTSTEGTPTPEAAAASWLSRFTFPGLAWEQGRDAAAEAAMNDVCTGLPEAKLAHAVQYGVWHDKIDPLQAYIPIEAALAWGQRIMEAIRALTPPADLASGEAGCCDVCRRPIPVDTVVDPGVWAAISPTRDEGGHLCASCMVESLAAVFGWCAAKLVDAHDETQRDTIGENPHRPDGASTSSGERRAPVSPRQVTEAELDRAMMVFLGNPPQLPTTANYLAMRELMRAALTAALNPQETPDAE